MQYEDKWEGVGPWKSRLFGALWNDMEPLGKCQLGPKKVRISRAHPTPTCPHQKCSVQGCINQRSIGSLMYLSSHWWLQQVNSRAHSSAVSYVVKGEGVQCSKSFLLYCRTASERVQCSKFSYRTASPPSAVNLKHKTYYKSTENCNVHKGKLRNIKSLIRTNLNFYHNCNLFL
jgi:hypothetical protein